MSPAIQSPRWFGILNRHRREGAAVAGRRSPLGGTNERVVDRLLPETHHLGEA